jgi:hypothetical protein
MSSVVSNGSWPRRMPICPMTPGSVTICTSSEKIRRSGVTISTRIGMGNSFHFGFGILDW